MIGQTKSLKAALLGLALMLAGAAHVRADNFYGMVALDNHSGHLVTYQFRWGENAAWQSYTLAPGQSRWHSWQYEFPNQNTSPRPYVRFDQDPQGSSRMKEYFLDVNAAPAKDVAHARRYAFRLSLLGNFVDLFKK